MGLGVGAVDHQPVRFACTARQTGEEAVEHAEAAPAEVAAVECFVRPIGDRGIMLAQAVADGVQDVADDALVVGARHTTE